MTNGYINIELTFTIIEDTPTYSCKRGTYTRLESCTKPVMLSIINSHTGDIKSNFVFKALLPNAFGLIEIPSVSSSGVYQTIYSIDSDDTVTVIYQEYPNE